MNEQKLLEMLPDHFSRLKQMREIAKAEGVQFDKLDASVDDLLNQGFISTATWGLRFWEERYKLPILDNTNYEERRHRILAKKRSNKANLLEILRAIEPSIELAWGPLILPFTINFSGDYYDFGELIRVIEEEKPSHLTYSFTVKPSGYTVRAEVAGRDRIALQLISGTSNAGRWPSANTTGNLFQRNIEIKGAKKTGMAEYQRSSGLVSGSKDRPTSKGVVARASIIIGKNVRSGPSEYVSSGSKKAGVINTDSFARMERKQTEIKKSISVGKSKPLSCGTIVSGQRTVI